MINQKAIMKFYAILWILDRCYIGCETCISQILKLVRLFEITQFSFFVQQLFVTREIVLILLFFSGYICDESGFIIVLHFNTAT